MGAEARSAGVAIVTLGCKVNRTESEALAEALRQSGVELAEATAEARVVVVNTCTVTAEADAKARKAIRHALAEGAADRTVVVTGCLAAIDPDGLRRLSDRVVVESGTPAGVAARVATLAGATSSRAHGGARRAGPAFRTRVMVKVQDGCDHRCAYCIVPDARGGPRSVPADEVVARVRALAAAGTREVVLTGINIGRYADASCGGLAGLVGRIAGTGIERIRLSSIEPRDLDDALLTVLASTPSVLRHLHVPLQSGCDRTLSAMARGYDASAYADALGRAREALPGLVVTTDVIAGFPGETDADFDESLAFIGSCGFSKLHVFRYSARAGTPAASLPSQVDPRARAARAATLRALSLALEAEHAASRVGDAADVLVETVGDGFALGTTEDHLRVRVTASGVAPGEIVRVILREPCEGRLRAVPAPADR